VAESGGLLNAHQHFGHHRFSSQILAFQSLPRSIDLAAIGSESLDLGARRDNCGDNRRSVDLVSDSGCRSRMSDHNHRGAPTSSVLLKEMTLPTECDALNTCLTRMPHGNRCRAMASRLAEAIHPQLEQSGLPPN
jgi:hypothetical protein